MPSQQTKEFWEAVADGRLLIQTCQDCDALQYYPRGHCLRCFGSNLGWRAASGRATLHTFTVVVRGAADAPYVFAIVDLEEGVRMTSRLVDVDSAEVRCDMELKVVFRNLDDDGPVLPLFTERVSAA